MTSVVAAFLFFLLIFHLSFCSGSSYVGCIKSEREALLRFKHDLIDPSNRLASWSEPDGDCCQWAGVVCNNSTGHVLRLNLRNHHLKIFLHNEIEIYTDYKKFLNSKIGGMINPSLFDLKELIHLDLSFNDFEGIQIPNFFCHIKKLNYLNLSTSNFGGIIPYQLGNLSHLQYLDLSTVNSYVITLNVRKSELYVDNLGWLYHLTSLKHLNLNGVNLRKISYEWLPIINILSHLEVLELSSCGLQHPFHQSVANFSSLTTLHLSYNYFGHSIPTWIFNLDRLDFLDLRGSGFQGPIPDSLQNLTLIRHLDLSNNHFDSAIPDWLLKNSHLEFLSRRSNDFQGSIPDLFGNLSSIKILNLSQNKFGGSVPPSFGRLCNLMVFDMSALNLNTTISQVLEVFSGCVSTKLEILGLESCQLSGHLSDDIGRFKNLKYLGLHENNIYGHIPFSLWELLSLEYLTLSNNKLNATLSQNQLNNLTRISVLLLGGNSNMVVKADSNWKPPFQLEVLSCRSCNMGPYFPVWILSQMDYLYYLDISDNKITDVFPSWFWKSVSQLRYLNLSHNHFHQKIPSLFHDFKTPVKSIDLSFNSFYGPLPQISFDVENVLDLSNNMFSGSISQFLCHGNKSRNTNVLNLENNSLSGELPNCGWMNWQKLKVLNLGNNKFYGQLPNFMGNLNILQSLVLRSNNFSGIELLENCTNLRVLDASHNQFDADVHKIIGARFERLQILIFRSNKLHGSLSKELCNLSSLRILDLANNHLTGGIPSCIIKMTALRVVKHSLASDIMYVEVSGYLIEFKEHILLVQKGMIYEYSTILNLIGVIDLSNNKLSGDIPKELTNLKALWWLNLSHNSLTGKIPDTTGNMGDIAIIDLSENQLSGEIPESITSLTFLSYLNVSNNKLFGRIPSGTQLQTLDTSCFSGNHLYGCPLTNDCNVSLHAPGHWSDPHNEGSVKEGYIHGVNGFYIGMVLGFVMGFWGFVGALVINRRWSYMYYGFLDDVEVRIYLIVKKIWQ